MTASAFIALAAAIAIAFSTIGPGIGQGIAASKAMEAMARQPEMAGAIRTNMILALALIWYGFLITVLYTLMLNRAKDRASS